MSCCRSIAFSATSSERPPPRYHIVKYAGVLASASPLRSRIAPVPAVVAAQGDDGEALVPERRGTYRPWAELLKRTFDFDVLQCPSCGGRMKLLALVTDSSSVARYLRAFGEPVDVPGRSPSRGPPWGRASSCAESRSATSRRDPRTPATTQGPRFSRAGVPSSRFRVHFETQPDRPSSSRMRRGCPS
jgi:hypothetical protein